MTPHFASVSNLYGLKTSHPGNFLKNTAFGAYFDSPGIILSSHTCAFVHVTIFGHSFCLAI